MLLYLSFVVMLIGALMIYFAMSDDSWSKPKHPKAYYFADHMFWCGLLAFLLQIGPYHLPFGGK